MGPIFSVLPWWCDETIAFQKLVQYRCRLTVSLVWSLRLRLVVAGWKVSQQNLKISMVAFPCKKKEVSSKNGKKYTRRKCLAAPMTRKLKCHR